MYRILALSLALYLAACDSGDPFNGPAQVAIDPSTNYQEATVAESDSLSRTVDAVLWRGRDSRGISRIQLVTPAYAQTAVDGAPVPGKLVNAVPVGDCHLVPWNPAAITDEDGKARFWFDPGVKAGLCTAEVRYTDGVVRIVTDTAYAIVAPGPYEGGYAQMGNIAFDSVTVLPADLIHDRHGNPIPYRLEAAPGDTLIRVIGGEVGTESGRTLVWRWHESMSPSWDRFLFAVLADETKVKINYQSGGGIQEWIYQLYE